MAGEAGEKCLRLSINSPSGEGGGSRLSVKRNRSENFPLILLQAKAGGAVAVSVGIAVGGVLSINSPSGEGGGISSWVKEYENILRFH